MDTVMFYFPDTARYHNSARRQESDMKFCLTTPLRTLQMKINLRKRIICKIEELKKKEKDIKERFAIYSTARHNMIPIQSCDIQDLIIAFIGENPRRQNPF